MKIRKGGNIVKFCVYTDEISGDINRAIELGTEKKINHFGLRTVYGKRFPFYDEEDSSIIFSPKKKFNISIDIIVPGIYRNSIDQTPWEQLKQIGYPEIFNFAEKFDCKQLLVYGGPMYATDTEYRYLVDNIKKFSHRLESRNCHILLGQSVTSYCNSLELLKKVQKDLDISNLGLSWDPCKAFCDGVLDINKDINKLILHLRNVRITDVVKSDTNEWEYVPIGTGLMDWQKIFTTLKLNGYKGLLTLETHCLNQENAFLSSMTALEQMNIVKNN